MNGIEIEQLRHLIEDTLRRVGMSDIPWYCVVEPSSERQRMAAERRPAHRSIRVVWKRRERVLEFFDLRGDRFQTVSISNDRPEGPVEMSVAGSSA